MSEKIYFGFTSMLFGAIFLYVRPTAWWVSLIGVVLLWVGSSLALSGLYQLEKTLSAMKKTIQEISTNSLKEV